MKEIEEKDLKYLDPDSVRNIQMKIVEEDGVIRTDIKFEAKELPYYSCKVEI